MEAAQTAGTVHIECCTKCSTHTWCTRHDEQKYLSVFEAVRSAILDGNPGLQVVLNVVPAHLTPLRKDNPDNKFYDTLTKKCVYYPELGAFEVRYEGILIFSKHESQCWPEPVELAQLIGRVRTEKQKTGGLEKYSRFVEGAVGAAMPPPLTEQPIDKDLINILRVKQPQSLAEHENLRFLKPKKKPAKNRDIQENFKFVEQELAGQEVDRIEDLRFEPTIASNINQQQTKKLTEPTEKDSSSKKCLLVFNSSLSKEPSEPDRQTSVGRRQPGNIIGCMDERETFYGKSQPKPTPIMNLSLTDHFKMYRSQSKKNAAQEHISENFKKLRKEISVLTTQNENRRQELIHMGDGTIKVPELLNESKYKNNEILMKLPEFVRKKPLGGSSTHNTSNHTNASSNHENLPTVAGAGAKEASCERQMIVRLDNIEEEAHNLSDEPNERDSCKMRRTGLGIIREWDKELERLEDRFSRFEQKVQIIKQKKIEFDNEQLSMGQSNALKGFRSEESMESKQRVSIADLDKNFIASCIPLISTLQGNVKEEKPKHVTQDYFGICEEEKNKKLKRIYGRKRTNQKESHPTEESYIRKSLIRLDQTEEADKNTSNPASHPNDGQPKFGVNRLTNNYSEVSAPQTQPKKQKPQKPQKEREVVLNMKRTSYHPASNALSKEKSQAKFRRTVDHTPLRPIQKKEDKSAEPSPVRQSPKKPVARKPLVVDNNQQRLFSYSLKKAESSHSERPETIEKQPREQEPQKKNSVMRTRHVRDIDSLAEDNPIDRRGSKLQSSPDEKANNRKFKVTKKSSNEFSSPSKFVSKQPGLNGNKIEENKTDTKLEHEDESEADQQQQSEHSQEQIEGEEQQEQESAKKMEGTTQKKITQPKPDASRSPNKNQINHATANEKKAPSSVHGSSVHARLSQPKRPQQETIEEKPKEPAIQKGTRLNNPVRLREQKNSESHLSSTQSRGFRGSELREASLEKNNSTLTVKKNLTRASEHVQLHTTVKQAKKQQTQKAQPTQDAQAEPAVVEAEKTEESDDNISEDRNEEEEDQNESEHVQQQEDLPSQGEEEGGDTDCKPSEHSEQQSDKLQTKKESQKMQSKQVDKQDTKQQAGKQNQTVKGTEPFAKVNPQQPTTNKQTTQAAQPQDVTRKVAPVRESSKPKEERSSKPQPNKKESTLNSQQQHLSKHQSTKPTDKKSPSVQKSQAKVEKSSNIKRESNKSGEAETPQKDNNEDQKLDEDLEGVDGEHQKTENDSHSEASEENQNADQVHLPQEGQQPLKSQTQSNKQPQKKKTGEAPSKQQSRRSEITQKAADKTTKQQSVRKPNEQSLNKRTEEKYKSKKEPEVKQEAATESIHTPAQAKGNKESAKDKSVPSKLKTEKSANKTIKSVAKEEAADANVEEQHLNSSPVEQAEGKEEQESQEQEKSESEEERDVEQNTDAIKIESGNTVKNIAATKQSVDKSEKRPTLPKQKAADNSSGKSPKSQHKAATQKETKPVPSTEIRNQKKVVAQDKQTVRTPGPNQKTEKTEANTKADQSPKKQLAKPKAQPEETLQKSLQAEEQEGEKAQKSDNDLVSQASETETEEAKAKQDIQRKNLAKDGNPPQKSTNKKPNEKAATESKSSKLKKGTVEATTKQHHPTAEKKKTEAKTDKKVDQKAKTKEKKVESPEGISEGKPEMVNKDQAANKQEDGLEDVASPPELEEAEVNNVAEEDTGQEDSHSGEAHPEESLGEQVGDKSPAKQTDSRAIDHKDNKVTKRKEDSQPQGKANKEHQKSTTKAISTKQEGSTKKKPELPKSNEKVDAALLDSSPIKQQQNAKLENSTDELAQVLKEEPRQQKDSEEQAEAEEVEAEEAVGQSENPIKQAAQINNNTNTSEKAAKHPKIKASDKLKAKQSANSADKAEQNPKSMKSAKGKDQSDKLNGKGTIATDSNQPKAKQTDPKTIQQKDGSKQERTDDPADDRSDDEEENDQVQDVQATQQQHPVQTGKTEGEEVAPVASPATPSQAKKNNETAKESYQKAKKGAQQSKVPSKQQTGKTDSPSPATVEVASVRKASESSNKSPSQKGKKHEEELNRLKSISKGSVGSSVGHTSPKPVMKKTEADGKDTQKMKSPNKAGQLTTAASEKVDKLEKNNSDNKTREQKGEKMVESASVSKKHKQTPSIVKTFEIGVQKESGIDFEVQVDELYKSSVSQQRPLSNMTSNNFLSPAPYSRSGHSAERRDHLRSPASDINALDFEFEGAQDQAKRASILHSIYFHNNEESKIYPSLCSTVTPKSKYVDVEFGESQALQKLEGLVWQRISDRFPKATVFEGTFDCSDLAVQPGTNSSLYSVLKILLEKGEHLLTRLFEKAPPAGMYSVWLCCQSAWRSVTVDDFIPFSKSGKPAFIRNGNQSHNTEQCIWPLILEKAIAKVFGGYASLSTLGICTVFKMLTGSNFLTFRVKEDPSQNQRCLGYLAECEKKNFIAQAERYPSKDGNQETAPQVFRLVGLQTINSTPLIKAGNKDKLLSLRTNAEPFWIKLESFCEQFKYVHVLQLRQNYVHSHISVDLKKTSFTVVELSVPAVSSGSICLEHLSEPPAVTKTILYREEENNLLRLVGQACEKNKQHIFFDCQLLKGRYYLFLESGKQNSTANLSYFGEQTVRYRVVDQIDTDTLKNGNSEYVPVQEKENRSQSASSFPRTINFGATDPTGSRYGGFGEAKKSRENRRVQLIRKQFVDFLLNGQENE